MVISVKTKIIVLENSNDTNVPEHFLISRSYNFGTRKEGEGRGGFDGFFLISIRFFPKTE